ncbi:MAG: SRPBCC family protein [Longimicrobiales bacterium]
MKFDLESHLGRVERTVEGMEYEGKPARAVRLERTYSTTVDDLWDAVTNPERLPRWFLPVTGDLRPGGRYQLQGNAEGTITQCEPPRLLFVTWEFGGGMSWVEVRLSAESDADARMMLTHIVPVDEHWQKYGAGATGVGWDLGLVGLALHLDQPDARPVDEAAFFASAEGKAFIRASSENWGDAASAGGEDAGQALAAMRETTAFYTGEPMES